MISVAMATYNGARFIEEQLDSILHQTCPVDEVVIHDDRSTDDTVEIVQNYIEKYGLGEKWKITINENNLGYADNFMGAVKETKGDFVFFCDQDDVWVADRVESMVSVMKTNEKIMVLGSEFEVFTVDPDAPQVSKNVLRKFTNDGSVEHIILNPETVFIGSEGCVMCLRREFLSKTLEYWYSGWAHDEYAWKLSLCLDGCYILHKTTLKRRMHSGNVSKRKMRDIKKRVTFLEELNKSHMRTLEFAKSLAMDDYIVKMYERNIKATNLRIELLERKRIINIIPLILRYSDCYHSKKSIPVELKMAIFQ